MRHAQDGRVWGLVLAGSFLGLLALSGAGAGADEYPAGEFSRKYEGYVKEARQTYLDFLDGSSAPGTFVKRRRRYRHVEYHYRRDDCALSFRFDYPPDILRNGDPVTIPLVIEIFKAGIEPFQLTATPSIKGIRNPERVQLVPARAFRRVRSGPVTVERGKITFTPRLDWDDRELVLSFAYADASETRWKVGEFHFYSSLEGPRHRDRPHRDIAAP